MSKFKGFSAKAKVEASRQRDKTKFADPRLTLKLEKYIATEFGNAWNQNCILVADETELGVVKLVIPDSEHSKFDDSKLARIEALAIEFGLKQLEVDKSQLDRDRLIQSYTSRQSFMF